MTEELQWVDRIDVFSDSTVVVLTHKVTDVSPWFISGGTSLFGKIYDSTTVRKYSLTIEFTNS